MKLIIDIPEDVYNKILEIYNSCEELHTRENLYQTIANGTPYEERPQDNLIQSLTELCNKYCKNCPITYAPNDCTDCICTHIRGIMNEVKDE